MHNPMTLAFTRFANVRVHTPAYLTILPHFHKHVTFDPLTELAPISLVLKNSMLLLSNAEPAGSSPEEAAAFIRTESEKNARLVRQAGLKVE